MSRLSHDRLDVVPIVHGRLAFAREVRRRLLAHRYQLLAVELPRSLRPGVEEAVDLLPRVSVVLYSHRPRFLDGEAPLYYVPIQPADGIVEALRIAGGERIPVAYIDAETEDYHGVSTSLPDPHGIATIGLEAYVESCAPLLAAHPRRPEDSLRESFMAQRLEHLLADTTGRILFVCGLAHAAPILERLASPVAPAEFEESPALDVRVEPVHDRSLAHVMGELPYIVGRYELHRRGIHLDEFDPTRALKQLVVAARRGIDSGSLEYSRETGHSAVVNSARLHPQVVRAPGAATPDDLQSCDCGQGVRGQ